MTDTERRDLLLKIDTVCDSWHPGTYVVQLKEKLAECLRTLRDLYDDLRGPLTEPMEDARTILKEFDA
jgi:hypothetical protein